MKTMKSEDISSKSNSTVLSWCQDTKRHLQVARKADILPELTIMAMKCDCETLEYTIHLIQEANKKLEFVLKLLSPFVAVYPSVSSAFKIMNGVKNTLQQLDGHMRKRIALNDKDIDWNLALELQKEEIEKQEDFKLCHSSVYDEDHEIVVEKDFTEMKGNSVKVSQITIKDLIMIGMLAIFIMFDPLGVFKIYG